MANENRCPKCGEPLTNFNRGGELVFDCHYDPKDCRIKELENRVRELTQRDPSCYDMSAEDAFKFAAEKQNKVLELERQLEEAKAELSEPGSRWKRYREQRDAALAQVVVLRRLEERETPCEWTWDYEEKGWKPACGDRVRPPDDHQFCPGCGHPVQVKQPQDAAEE